jgi:hypothetical protein
MEGKLKAIIAVSALLLAGISGAAAQSITGGDGVSTASPAILSGATSTPEIILECKKAGGRAMPPSDCHLTKGHTLDDVMKALWEQQQFQRVMANERAEELKQRVKLIPPQKVKAKPPVASVEEPR